MPESQRPALYDFRQAHSLSADQLKELQEHYANLGRALHRYIPETTGLAARFTVDRLAAMTYNEYLDTLPEAPIMAICQFDAHASPLIWQMDAAPMFAYMDAMLGGDGSSLPPSDRELTILERALAVQVIGEFVYTWTDVWPALAEAAPHVTEVRQTTGRFGAASLQESVIATWLTCNMGEVEGSMCIAMPSTLLRGLLKQSAIPSLTLSPDDLGHWVCDAEVGQCEVSVTAVLAHATLTLRRLSSLRPGDVLLLDRAPNDQLQVLVAGLPKFSGISGLVDGHLAVRLTASLRRNGRAAREGRA